MNCEYVAEHISAIVAGSLPAAELDKCRQHLASCTDCEHALRGAESVDLLRRRDTGDVPLELFERISADLPDMTGEGGIASRFWLGTGFGGVVAASVFALSLALGWIGLPEGEQDEVPEFVATLGEARTMDIAIETDRPLQGANLSIVLSGGVELDGYGGSRELAWTADLHEGVNRLSLPVVAIGEEGGRMVVRLSHPQSEQVFVVRLKAGA